MQHLEQWRSLKPKENDVTQCMYTKMTGSSILLSSSFFILTGHQKYTAENEQG